MSLHGARYWFSDDWGAEHLEGTVRSIQADALRHAADIIEGWYDGKACQQRIREEARKLECPPSSEKSK